MNKKIVRSLLAEMTIKFSNHFVYTAIMFAVFQQSKKAIDLGYAGVAMILPALLFTCFSNHILLYIQPFNIMRYALLIRSAALIAGGIFADSMLSLAILGAFSSLLQQAIGTAKLTYDTDLVATEGR